jgi:DNA-binding CsgD family transcriptional regulator
LAAGSERPGGADGGQGRLFAAVRDALAVSSVTSPLLVIIEDLHWADASTLDLLSYLARSVENERLLLLLTARLDALPRRHPLLGVVAELGRLPWIERIDLARFDERELAQLLTGILGRLPDPGVSRSVFERSDGNAFFAEELLATSAAKVGPLPASLRDVLAARLAALDDATQAILRIAAVAGRVVSHELLERVAGVPSADLLRALREAVEQRVLVHVTDPAPGYAFRHALVREAAYDDLLATERVAIHRAIADHLERDASLSAGGELARAGEVAYHAMAAHDVARALRASIAAAASADEASAYAEAELHLGRLLEIWPQISNAEAQVGTDHPELLARSARAAASAGHQARATRLALDALGELAPDDDTRRIALLLELFDYGWESADIGTADRAVLEVMPLLGDERSPRRAEALAARALLDWHHGRYTSGRDAALGAIEIARDHGAKRELALALTVLGQIYAHLGETFHAETVLVEAEQIYGAVRDPVGRARSGRWRAWARFMHGSFEESLEHERRALAVARQEGADARLGVNLLDGVLENLVELGRWSEAATTADEIMARMTLSFEMVYSHMSVARMYTLMGRLADAEREIARGSELSAVGPHRVWQLEDTINLAYASGRASEGRALMEESITAAPEPDRDGTLWWSLVKAVSSEADRAEAARTRRRTSEADDAVAAGRRFADLFRGSAARAIEADGASPMVTAFVRTADAEERRLVSEPDPLLWAAAVEARRILDQPWELAYARYRHAEAILASGGSAVDATIPLREAHGAAKTLGAEPLRSSIEALASRARIDLVVAETQPPGWPRPPTTLTARELEVLALVGAGHTNREIGDRLFITEKTASVHVTHAMDKLGALSRYDAAATAARLGLLEPLAVRRGR